MLADVVACLRCPVCGGGLTCDERSLRCAGGHAFDIARQGYAGLLTGGIRAGTADTAAMVAARAEFLAGGHFAPLAGLVADLAAERAKRTEGTEGTEGTEDEAGAVGADGGCVLDAGAGTGYYLSAVLDRLPGTPGVALDASKHALRRAARAHPRVGALTWDVWRPLPVRTGAVSVLLDIFAPRNAGEFHRVLRPGGTLIVVTPAARHLEELVGELGLLTVDPRKAERVEDTLGGRFRAAGTWPLQLPLRLTHAEVAALAAMGPSAWHTEPGALRARIGRLAEPVPVTAAFEVRVFDAHTKS
jgi:23S rRNA (guanine745-N1)-methyltransferase